MWCIGALQIFSENLQTHWTDLTERIPVDIGIAPEDLLLEHRHGLAGPQGGTGLLCKQVPRYGDMLASVHVVGDRTDTVVFHDHFDHGAGAPLGKNEVERFTGTDHRGNDQNADRTNHGSFLLSFLLQRC